LLPNRPPPPIFPLENFPLPRPFDSPKRFYPKRPPISCDLFSWVNRLSSHLVCLPLDFRVPRGPPSFLRTRADIYGRRPHIVARPKYLFRMRFFQNKLREFFRTEPMSKPFFVFFLFPPHTKLRSVEQPSHLSGRVQRDSILVISSLSSPVQYHFFLRAPRLVSHPRLSVFEAMNSQFISPRASFLLLRERSHSRVSFSIQMRCLLTQTRRK